MTWATPIPPLRHGEIRDAGYSEFIVSASFAEVLLDGGMTHLNGQPVSLKIVDRLEGIGGVTMRWTRGYQATENQRSTAEGPGTGDSARKRATPTVSAGPTHFPADRRSTPAS